MSFRQELLDSIHPEMKLDKTFFRRIYAYSVYCPEFADKAIKALNEAGCSKAQAYYDDIVSECKRKQDEAFKAALPLLRNTQKADWNKLEKEGEGRRKQGIQSLTKGELTRLCQKLLQEGIIEKPEQFATAVLQER